MANILIADDTASERALMAGVIEQLGHEHRAVGDGISCLETAKELKPDLILLDVVMPKMDGFQTCRRLKKDPETASIPVVIVSSKDQETDKFWAQRQGADHYIIKPYKPALLIDVIRRFLG